MKTAGFARLRIPLLGVSLDSLPSTWATGLPGDPPSAVPYRRVALVAGASELLMWSALLGLAVWGFA